MCVRACQIHRIWLVKDSEMTTVSPEPIPYLCGESMLAMNQRRCYDAAGNRNTHGMQHRKFSFTEHRWLSAGVCRKAQTQSTGGFMINQAWEEPLLTSEQRKRKQQPHKKEQEHQLGLVASCHGWICCVYVIFHQFHCYWSHGLFTSGDPQSIDK